MLIVYYVNSHGFGHARRTSAIVQALLRLNPDLRVEIRTKAPKAVFNLNERVTVKAFADGFAIKEYDALNINVTATVDGVLTWMQQYDSLVRKEADEIQCNRPLGIVSDIAFLAGDIATELGIPCIGIANFTWDWVLQLELQKTEEGRLSLSKMRSAYQKMGLLLKPKEFSQDMNATFGSATTVIETPMIVCSKECTSVFEAQRRLAERLILDISMFENIVYCDIRGIELSSNTLQPAAMDLKRTLFLIRAKNERGVKRFGNVISLDNDVSYDDAFNASSVVISKLGYCTVVSSIADKKRLLFASRKGFREDGLLRDVTRYIPSVEISSDLLMEAKWQSQLGKLLSLPFPAMTPGKDGAECAATSILEFIDNF